MEQLEVEPVTLDHRSNALSITPHGSINYLLWKLTFLFHFSSLLNVFISLSSSVLYLCLLSSLFLLVISLFIVAVEMQDMILTVWILENLLTYPLFLVLAHPDYPGLKGRKTVVMLLWLTSIRVFLAGGWEWERWIIIASVHNVRWCSHSCSDWTDSNAGSTKEALSSVLRSKETPRGALLLWNVSWMARPLPSTVLYGVPS